MDEVVNNTKSASDITGRAPYSTPYLGEVAFTQAVQNSTGAGFDGGCCCCCGAGFQNS